MTEAHEKADFDVLIAGGGMIGTSLGLALAPLGLKVAVVEAVSREAAEQPSFDDRSTAIARSTQRMFEAMQLWEAIRVASTPIADIHVSDRGRFGFSHINATQQQVEALGYVVINRVLGRVLQSSLVENEGVELMCPARISALEHLPDSVRVTVDEQGLKRFLTARLLVAADGAQSQVREMAGISATTRDYQQSAVIGNLLPEQKPCNRAFERFTESGPLALLPITDDRVAFVWVQPPELAQERLALPDDKFLEAIQDVFGYRLGKFSKVGRRAVYPLSLSRANSLIARRCAVVGNAANGLHPVAAQGFNLGMRDVAALSDCIAEAAAEGDAKPDCGDADLLENYAEWRFADHRKLVAFTDGVVRLFGNSRPPLRLLRSLGMLGFDSIPGVRKLFARHTMGLAGRLPRLSRGVPLK